VSGLIDLTGIAARAYTPVAKSAEQGAQKAETSQDKKPVRSIVNESGLAPAFSIELSLAAQKILAGTSQTTQTSEPGAPLARATANPHFSEGVGRREAPAASQLRDVAPGSRLNIQI